MTDRDITVQDGTASSDAAAERDSLATKICELIESDVDADAARFDDIALEVFEFQYANNEPYARYCDAIGAVPDQSHIGPRYLSIPHNPSRM